MANSRHSHTPTSVAAAFPQVEAQASPNFTHAAMPTEGGEPPEVVLYLDPFAVEIPDTPNRLAEAYEDEEFETLRLGILSCGFNVNAIEVRRVHNPEGGWIYVLVFGERRLRACREAKVKVRAIVRADEDAARNYLDRMRENSGRADLAPIEFARQVQHMVDGPAKMRKTELASKLGVSLAMISRAYDLACLPQVIVQAFVSAREIRYRDLKPLKDAWACNPEAVTAEIERMRAEPVPVPGPEVVRRIAAAAKGAKDELAPCKSTEEGAHVPLSCGDVQIGSWRTGASGQLEVNVDAAMSAAQKAALLKHIAAFVEKKVLLLPNKSTAPSIEVAP